MLICPDTMVRREFALLSEQAATLLSHLSVIFGGDKRPASASSVRDRVRACLGHIHAAESFSCTRTEQNEALTERH